MDNNNLLSQIAEDIKAMKQQLNNFEMKVEQVNKRVELAQEETIGTLSELIHEGYSQHENRIKILEEHLLPSQS